MKKFYDISHDDKYNEVEYIEGTKWESIKCPKYPGHQRNGDRIGNLKVKLAGKKYGDFLWTFLDWIITEEVVKIFRDNKISGYKLKPVEITNRKLPYKLNELIVTGKGGDAHADSGICLKGKCDYCSLKYYSAFENGIIVNENNWDGSDLFTVTGYPGYNLITEKVKDLIVEHKLTGVIITPAHELKWPEGVIKP